MPGLFLAIGGEGEFDDLAVEEQERVGEVNNSEDEDYRRGNKGGEEDEDFHPAKQQKLPSVSEAPPPQKA